MEANTPNTVLLVMDMQSSIVSRIPDSGAILTPVAKAIANARSKKIPVIFVVVGFRAGIPEISMNNKGFSALGDKSNWTAGAVAEWVKIHPDVAPLDDEVIVTKRRVSAFTGSDLEVILRAQNYQHLVLTGIATSGVVLSTTREASDKDYRITILSDACADGDEEVHRVLMTKVFPRQAEVITTEEWSRS